MKLRNKFWKEWFISSELEQRKLLLKLTGIDELNVSIMNSYFIDLSMFLESVFINKNKVRISNINRNHSRQTKPETQPEGLLSNALDGKERPFIRDKTADTFNKRTGAKR